MKRITLLVLVFFLAPLPSFAAPPLKYTLTDLGPTYAISVDDAGMVVGATTSPGQNPAIIAPTPTTIVTTGGSANGSAASRVVGGAMLPNGGSTIHFDQHAFVREPDGTLTDLGTPGAPSAATGINAQGIITGYGEDLNVITGRAFVWVNGVRSALPTLGGERAYADAVNAAGWVVGESDTPSGVPHATLWLYGFPFDLDTLGSTFSIAFGINSLGQVVGNVVPPGKQYQGFLWSFTSGMKPLGILPGFGSSSASSINDLGQIVGESTGGGDYPPPQRAVLFTDSQVIDLNTLVKDKDNAWVLEYATSINNDGQIVGYGKYQGSPRSWMLTPDVPPGLARKNLGQTIKNMMAKVGKK